MKLSVFVAFLFLNVSAGQQKRQTRSIGSRVERFQGILYTVFSRKNAASTTIVKTSLKKKNLRSRLYLALLNLSNVGEFL